MSEGLPLPVASNLSVRKILSKEFKFPEAFADIIELQKQQRRGNNNNKLSLSNLQSDMDMQTNINYIRKTLDKVVNVLGSAQILGLHSVILP